MTKDTSPDVAGVVERLRKLANHRLRTAATSSQAPIAEHMAATGGLAQEAASLLTSQAQEIERLREALKPFAEAAERFDQHVRAFDHIQMPLETIHFRRARDLIKGEGE